jgi:ADP-ribosylglycohydrolase
MPRDSHGRRNRGRIRGCLLGGAVGAALGAAVEFLSIDEIRHRYSNSVSRASSKGLLRDMIPGPDVHVTQLC